MALFTADQLSLAARALAAAQCAGLRIVTAETCTAGLVSGCLTSVSGASKTFGLYYMYDVKQADPSEWSSPPFEGRVPRSPGSKQSSAPLTGASEGALSRFDAPP